MYNFSNDWFDRNISPWNAIKNRKGWDDSSQLIIVEIGSFEGRSTCWMLENLVLNPNSKLYALDTFAGAAHSPQDRDTLLPVFMNNINTTGKANQVEVMVGPSSDKLVELISKNVNADFIYVDGSHLAKDVLADAVLSWKLLKPGGIMIFDDYFWKLDESNANKNPKIAVDAFTNIYLDEINFLEGLPNYQIYIQKKLEDG